MNRTHSVLLVLVALCIICPAVAAGQAAPGVVRGEVTDISGGVLPGVTVVAAAPGGKVLATTATDGAGGYAFEALPAGPVTLTFQLDGFASVTVALEVQPRAASQVVERLELAPFSETVVVRARVVVEPPAPFVPSTPQLPLVMPVPEHDRDSICGPAKRSAYPEPLGTIKSGRSEPQKKLYAAGADLIIAGGLRDGLEVGRNLVARRYYHALGAASADPVAEHSAGLVQIVLADEHSAIAVVVYACDELRPGDFLAAFTPQPVRDPDPPGFPEYRNAARILFADEGQTLGAPRRLMVINHGAAHGTRVGERLTLFREPRGTARRAVIGEAVVVAVRADSATIRVDRVTDAVAAGDWAATQVASAAASP